MWGLECSLLRFRRNEDSRATGKRVRVPVPQLCIFHGSVPLGKSLSLSGPQFLHLSNEGLEVNMCSSARLTFGVK